MKSGVGRDSGGPSTAPSSSASCSPSHSRRSTPDTSFTASPSAGTRLPTSVVKRKASTARPHLSSAWRSRIFHRSFHLPVSFRTSAHGIFCASRSGHTLMRCSRVWLGAGTTGHCGMGRFFVQLRYCPVRRSGRTARLASWCSQLPCRPASGFSAFGTSSWKSDLQPTRAPPSISSRRCRFRSARDLGSGIARASARSEYLSHSTPRVSSSSAAIFAHSSAFSLPAILVRWASPGFDDDAWPGPPQRGDVLPRLEDVLPAKARLLRCHTSDGGLGIPEDCDALWHGLPSRS